jgi:hypothetical protein
MARFTRGSIRALRLVAIGALALGCPAQAAQADFIQTMASGVYQSTDGQTKVLVSSKPNAQGIFILEGPAIPPQEFNLENMPADGSRQRPAAGVLRGRD